MTPPRRLRALFLGLLVLHLAACRPEARRLGRVDSPLPPGVAAALAAPDGETDLLGVAMEIARDAGEEFDPEALRRLFARMADPVRQSVAERETLSAKIAALNEYFFNALAFEPSRGRGRNRFHVNQVVNAKEGYCLGLAIPYLVLARSVGLRGSLVTVPGHGFLRMRGSGTERRNVELLQYGRFIPDKEYRRAYAIRPELETRGVYLRDLSDRELVAELYANEAFHKLERNRTRGALADADRALFLRPGHPDALVNRGLALWRLGDAGTARAAWTKALGEDPDSVEARRLLERTDGSKETPGHAR